MTDTPAAPHTPSDDPRVRELHHALCAAWAKPTPSTRPADDEARDLLARLDAAAPAPESPREERDRLYREHVQACTDPRHKHPALDTPNDTPQFDWQAAEEGFVPCARGQRCELQLVRPGKVQCDCDTPGTEAAIARAEAEATPADRDDARATVVLPDPEGVEHDGAMHWRVHDYTGDDEYGAEGETWTVQLDVAGVVHLDGNPIAPAADLALAVLAAARCRDRLGATTNTTPEESTDD